MNIFISHSSEDFKVAEEVCNLLEEKGHKCFLAPRDIRSGYQYAEEIINGIERSDVMLILMSKAANQSPHVLREVERAVSKYIPLIVYKLEEVELSKSMEYFIMSHQWVSAHAGASHSRILKCVKEFDRDHFEAGQEVKDVKKKRNKVPIIISVLFLLVVFLLIMLISSKGSESSQEEQEVVSENTVSEVKENIPVVEAGDTLVFGNYNGEPIEWRVLKVYGNTNKAVIVSKHILTMKPFDVAESGSYNYYNGQDYWFEDVREESAEVLRQIHGDNDWAKSNIRTWLNSESENVMYEDQKPLLISTSEYKNGYDTEPGFLSNFSKEEREAILETEIKTNNKAAMDKVFLLSKEELSWFEEADVSLIATPTEAALEQDDSNWYEVNVSSYGVEDYCWWLRDSNPEGLVCEAYLVGSSYSGCEIYTEIVGLEGYGIRPAMTIDLTANCFEVK